MLHLMTHFTTSIPVLKDEFLTSDLESSIALKACGFIGAERAQILDVTEKQLKLRIGQSWLAQLMSKVPERKLIDVAIEFEPDSEPKSPEEEIRQPNVAHSRVTVTVAPKSPRWNDREFQEAAHRLLFSLRNHFMAVS